jgi:hypothetical protein
MNAQCQFEGRTLYFQVPVPPPAKFAMCCRQCSRAPLQRLTLQLSGALPQTAIYRVLTATSETEDESHETHN